MLTDKRKRFVEGAWYRCTCAWKAPFTTKLNDVMVHTFYYDNDYDEIKKYLTERFGNA